MKKEDLIIFINNIDKDYISKSDIINLFSSNNLKEFKEYVVYYFLNNNEDILYIGRTTNYKERMRNHFMNPNILHNEKWKEEVVEIKYFYLKSFQEMELYEKGMISKYTPKYNKDLINLDFYVKELNEFFVEEKHDFLNNLLINIKAEDVLITLNLYIKNNNPDKIILVDWIRENFYDANTNQETVRKMYASIKSKLYQVSKEYELVVKKGRGQKAVFQKIINGKSS